jgi:beta-glucanase (GH16 family)
MKLLRHAFTFIGLVVVFALPVFTAMMLAQGVTLAPEGTEGETVYAPFPVNITLDGEFDDWDGIPQVEVSQGVGQEAVRFATAADNEHLYIWADVIDDTIITGEHNADFWNEDSLELYFNATGDLTLTSYTDGVAQLTIPPLNIDAAPEDVVTSGINGDTVEAQIVTVATETGWAVEVAVPLENTVWSITPEHEAEIGFQVKLNTASSLNRDGMLSWSINEPGDTSYQNPSVFGRLIFYEVSAEPQASGEYFFRSELAEDGLVDDFENGIWIQFKGDDQVIGLAPEGGASLSIRQALTDQELALPEQDADANNLLAVAYDETGGSYRHHFTDGLNPVTQDWSAYNAVGMWFYGDGSGRSVDVRVFNTDASVYSFEDETDGWQYLTIPFALLESETDFNAAAVSGYGIGVAAEDGGSGTLYIDNVTLFTMENTTAALWSDEQPQYSFVLDESINWDSREWTLVWSDEFEAEANASINTESWTCEVGGHGWGNNELEYYTTSPDNVSQDGEGNLVITAREGQPENDGRCWYGECAYTSARCTTQDKVEFTYGRVEARMKIPRGQGIWPAFWMLGADFPEVGWPNSGEIDILENIGREPNTLYGTIHGPGYSGASGLGGNIVVEEPLADDYHVYAIEWDPNVIRWYLDGELFNTISVNDLRNREWVYDHDFFIITNIAVGGSWPGFPDESTDFPQQLLVDYVRVYQLSNAGSTTD